MGAAIAALWQGHRAVIVTVAAAALVVATLAIVNAIYGRGEKAGAAGVTNQVQTETIRKVDAARREKEKANEVVRDKPIDTVIDGLR